MEKVTIDSPHFYCISYRKGNREMQIDLDLRDYIYYLNIDLVKSWNHPYELNNITQEEKVQILDDIYDWLVNSGTSINRIVKEYIVD